MQKSFEAKPYTAWSLLFAYWQSEHRVSAYTTLAATLLMTVGIVLLDVIFTYWYNHFYNALQDYQTHAAIYLLLIFMGLATLYIVLGVYRYYIEQLLGLRWRRWLTHQITDRWLQHKSYYYLESFTHHTDNPDQRIQEDINSIVFNSLSLLIGFLSSLTSVFLFIYVLWTLSGTLTIPLGTLGTLHIPGYLVWVSVLYALFGTWITFKIGRPLIGLNFEQQRREANFRFAATDVRTHAENIALYQGEAQQKNILTRMLSRVLENFYLIVLRQKRLLWFTVGYNQIALIVPLLLMLPNYFAKVFKLGGLMQGLSAFRSVQDSLSFLVNSYSLLAEWRAEMKRILSFLNHLNEIENAAREKNKIDFEKSSENKIRIQDLTLNTPGNHILLKNIHETIDEHEHAVITGHSGVGKSTLIRALAGLWPYGSGTITLPDKKIMFVPQRSYMPIGSLREALLFPDHHGYPIPDDDLIQLLNACSLDHLTHELNRVAPWSTQLSPGELQRIAFIRTIIQKPDWAFLDECTSALDLKHEKQCYELLKSHLPECTLVSVGHRPSILDYHVREVNLEKYRMI